MFERRSRFFSVHRMQRPAGEAMPSDRPQQVTAAVAQLHERWGSHLFRAQPRRIDPEIHPSIPTGFARLDRALGIGGIPRGALTECLGRGTAGLTTLALKAIVQAQSSRQEALAAWLDSALSFDADYAVRCGVALDRLLVVRTADHLADVLHTLVTSGGADMLVCDLRGRGVQAPDRLTMSRIGAALGAADCGLMLLAEPDRAGSYAQSALRLFLTRERWLMRGRDVAGYRVQAHILKNRYAPADRRVGITIGFSTTVHGEGL